MRGPGDPRLPNGRGTTRRRTAVPLRVHPLHDSQDQSYGLPIENAIKLAINDFVVASNGLPPAPDQTNRRQLLYLGCSDQSNAN